MLFAAWVYWISRRLPNARTGVTWVFLLDMGAGRARDHAGVCQLPFTMGPSAAGRFRCDGRRVCLAGVVLGETNDRWCGCRLNPNSRIDG